MSSKVSSPFEKIKSAERDSKLELFCNEILSNLIVFSLNLTSSPTLILNVLSLLRAAFNEIEMINSAKPICAIALP